MKMATRFDNLSLDQLVEREAETRAELDALAKALKARLVAECPVKIGYVYRFTGESLRTGKEFLVCSVRAENFGIFRGASRYAAGVHGFNALKNSTAGDGFGIKPHVVLDWRLLDIASERPGPRAGLVEYAALVARIETEACDGRL